MRGIQGIPICEADIMLKKILLRLPSVVLVVLCLVIPITAQMIQPAAGDTGLGGANSITGTVIASGQRLERHISVRLRTMTKGDRVVVTDDYGRFAFQGL